MEYPESLEEREILEPAIDEVLDLPQVKGVAIHVFHDTEDGFGTNFGVMGQFGPKSVIMAFRDVTRLALDGFEQIGVGAIYAYAEALAESIKLVVEEALLWETKADADEVRSLVTEVIQAIMEATDEVLEGPAMEEAKEEIALFEALTEGSLFDDEDYEDYDDYE